MFKPIRNEKVKGWLATPIEYEVRVPSGNWSKYFGDYNQQKWGVFDTQSCWALSAINATEDQLEYLVANDMFSAEALKFFYDHKYIDADGDFNLSERYLEILGGLRDAGGSSPYAWQLLQKYGAIPRHLLTYSAEQVEAFRNGQWGLDINAVMDDYFNPALITPEMKALGQQFRKHVNIAYQRIGKSWKTPERQVIEAALKQSPLCIGIPVPVNVFNYNQPYVQYDGATVPAHEVELYGITEKGEYLCFDQYEPHLKTLSADYFIAFCTQGIIYANKPTPVKQNIETNSMWTSIFNYINNALNKFIFNTETPPKVYPN